MSLASPEQEKRAQALRCWSYAQVDTVRAGAERVLTDWCAAWASEAQSVVRVSVLDDQPSPLQSPDAMQRALQALLLNGSAQAGAVGTGGPIARQVRVLAWGDLRARLLAWTGVDLVARAQASPCPPQPEAWSGELLLSWRCDELEGVWSLPGEAVARLIPPCNVPAPTLSPVVELGHALAEHLLTVQAFLSPVSLPLGELASLAPGDIVRLSHPLDQPLHLRLPGGLAPLCAGWLGQRHGRKALDLAPLPP